MGNLRPLRFVHSKLQGSAVIPPTRLQARTQPRVSRGRLRTRALVSRWTGHLAKRHFNLRHLF
ncbi:hypothetical protein JG687_00005964 [Phytophthora cactorum]|uniref:Uncharacterized protein n=1 Tax=Phytophthora cactorum TaxID=29920 RepID=A0A8T1UP74_9STRA|nr:hypothetical protein GQ600_18607 [Phytophthora cactorum]KAG6964471.1 hypothetical protein JG687_00005964 [Phytophthora cactorum]